MDDFQLLADYLRSDSQPAFAQLVSRYINMVYAAAFRQTRNAHLAEDVTQAVFITLAKKGSCVRGGSLAAWLLSTTRYAACNALKLERRRRIHEQKAAAMNPTTRQHESIDESIAADEDVPVSELLDEALAGLKPKDRGALAMRFFQSMSLRDIGSAMGTSEIAAQKRVSRAVDRMRAFFARRGMTLGVDQISTSLNHEAHTTAPAALTPLVMAVATKTSAAASASGAVAISNAIIRSLVWAPAKLAAAACVTIAIVAGAGAVVASHSSANPTANASAQSSVPGTQGTFTAEAMWTPYTPSNLPPISQAGITNLQVAGPINPAYTDGVDEKVVRTPGQFAGVVRSTPAAITKSAAYPRYPQILLGAYRGKRVRLSAYLKSDSVERGAGLNMIVFRGGGHRCAGRHERPRHRWNDRLEAV